MQGWGIDPWHRWCKSGYLSATIALKLESPAFMRGEYVKSNYLPNIDIDMHCDRLLSKKAMDICYSCSLKEPKELYIK
jgi:hypothetical protein